MSDGTQIDDGRQLFTWSWDQGRDPHHELADAIIASGAKLYNLNGRLVTPDKTGKATPVKLSHLQFIVAENVATKEWINHGTKSKPDWRQGDICSFTFQRRAIIDRKPHTACLRWLLTKGLVERAPKWVLQLKTPLPDKPQTYPKLTAAIAERVAPSQALDAIARELLPTLFGGEWVLDKGEGRLVWPSSEEWRLITPLYDHGDIFRQRGPGAQGWHNSVIISQPYNNYIFPNGGLYSGCTRAAQVLAQQCRVGTWISPELSSYIPGQTALVLLAGGLTPEHAPLFGFHTIFDLAVLKTSHKWEAANG